MKDPIRLLQGEASDAERALLRAALAEEPPADGSRRLMAALGIGAGASVPPPAASPAGTGTGTELGSAGGIGAEVAAGVGAKLLPWIAAGVIALGGGAWWLRSGTADEVPARTAQARPGASAAEPEPVAKAAAGSGISGEPAAAAPSGQGTGASAQTTASAAKSIAREVATLDAARAELARGTASEALARLDAYEREHPSGALREEAGVLRVEALAAVGLRDAARAAAQRFLRAHPGSPHAERVRGLAGGKPDDR